MAYFAEGFRLIEKNGCLSGVEITSALSFQWPNEILLATESEKLSYMYASPERLIIGAEATKVRVLLG